MFWFMVVFLSAIFVFNILDKTGENYIFFMKYMKSLYFKWNGCNMKIICEQHLGIFLVHPANIKELILLMVHRMGNETMILQKTDKKNS